MIDYIFSPLKTPPFTLKHPFLMIVFSVAIKKYSMQDNFIKGKKLIWLIIWEVQKHGTVSNWDLLRTHHRQHRSGWCVVCQGEIISPDRKLEHSICFLLQYAFQESKDSTKPTLTPLVRNSSHDLNSSSSAPPVKVLLGSEGTYYKPHHLGLISKTHTEGGENQLLQVFVWLPHVCCGTYVPTPTWNK